MENPKKKLCILVPGHWSNVMGGSQYQVKCLIDVLSGTEKYEIFYITRYISPEYTPKGYKVISVSDELYSKRSLQRIWNDAKALSSILSRICPDIIYQRVGCDFTGFAAKYARKNNCKMIWHVAHDMEVIPYKLSYSRDMVFRYVDKKLLEFGIYKARHIVAQTQNQARLLEKYYNRIPTSVIQNFHPFPHEKIDKSGLPTVVWIANLKSWKQPEIFIRLAKDLESEKGVQFIMIGALQGSKKWRQQLVEEIRGVNNLNYLGVCTQDEVNKILANAHIFVNTSKWEGFANTFIQAWMRKVPVVSLNLNPDSLFDDNNIGFHSVTYNNLKENVLTLLRNISMRYDMGERAQQYAFKNHSIDNVKDLMAIFDN